MKYFADRTLKSLEVDFVEDVGQETNRALETTPRLPSNKEATTTDRLVNVDAFQVTADFITFMIGLRAEAEPFST